MSLNFASQISFINKLEVEMIRGTRNCIGKYGMVKAIPISNIELTIRNAKVWIEDKEKLNIIDTVYNAVLKHTDYLVYKGCEVQVVTMDALRSSIRNLINNDPILKWAWIIQKGYNTPNSFEDEYIDCYRNIRFQEVITNGYHIVYYHYYDDKDWIEDYDGIIIVKTNSKLSVVESMDQYGINIYAEYRNPHNNKVMFDKQINRR